MSRKPPRTLTVLYTDVEATPGLVRMRVRAKDAEGVAETLPWVSMPPEDAERLAKLLAIQASNAAKAGSASSG